MSAIVLPMMAPCWSVQEAIDYLEGIHASPVGRGFYAQVFMVEDVGRVIKVAARDPGGLAAAEAAMLTSDYDDLAPRYYGITRFGGGNWMGEMELLTRTGADTDPTGLHHPSVRHYMTRGGEGREPNETALANSPYLQACLLAKEAHKRKYEGYASWDIHRDNVMLRGAQPVISDPLSIEYHGG